MKKWFNTWDTNNWVKVGEDCHFGPYSGKCVAVEYRPDLYSRRICMEVSSIYENGKVREVKDEMC